MNNNNILLACLMAFCIFGLSNTVEAQCPNCTVPTFAGMPADTIIVDSLPSAYKNAYYEEEMGYRLPYTTDPLAAVAPPGTSVPTGLSIDHFRILSVTGLPPGLSWVGDRPAPMTYNETSPATRDGCITLCGTPGASGTFIVNVNLEIQIQGFVFPSPPIPLEFIVYPDTNALFTVDTAAGCAPFGVVVNNLLPSNGNPGFSYFWDFNNGTTSTSENPDTVWYDFGLMTDTVIAITQQVIIDTFPYMLEAIVVATDPGNSCNDDVPNPIPGLPPISTNAPDMYAFLYNGTDTAFHMDPGFLLLGNAPNDEYPRDTMVFPGPFPMVTGQSYSLEIWDDDSEWDIIPGVVINADDLCGPGTMTLSSALGVGVHTLSTGTMTVEVTISHYIDTATYVDSVTIQYCNVPINYINQVDRSLMVYPNPTADLVNVQFQLHGTTETVEVMLNDLLGRTVYNEVVNDFNGAYNRQINLDKQADGVYVLHLYVGNDVLHRKVVLRK